MRTRKEPTSSNQKKVKAWAVMSENGKYIATVELSRKKPERFTIGTWVFFTNENTKIVPCTITYSLPAKKKKK